MIQLHELEAQPRALGIVRNPPGLIALKIINTETRPTYAPPWIPRCPETLCIQNRLASSILRLIVFSPSPKACPNNIVTTRIYIELFKEIFAGPYCVLDVYYSESVVVSLARAVGIEVL
jgi:hypothetical protein